MKRIEIEDYGWIQLFQHILTNVRMILVYFIILIRNIFLQKLLNSENTYFFERPIMDIAKRCRHIGPLFGPLQRPMFAAQRSLIARLSSF